MQNIQYKSIINTFTFFIFSIKEMAMHHVAMFIRSVPHWEIVEPLPDIGWRLRRQYFLIKPTDPTKKDQRSILTWVGYCTSLINTSFLT